LASCTSVSHVSAHEPACVAPHYNCRKSRASHTAVGSHGRHDPAMSRRVLIVDDNSAFRAVARRLLERGGFVVVAEAENGNEAVHEAESHRPDLALVDVQLPDFDGFEVAERLCRLDSSLQVILTSSLDGSDFGSLVAASRALGFVPKGELAVSAIEALLVSAV
jgi:two-component system, NarL family, nitrate/nitrite response regulator NarL